MTRPVGAYMRKKCNVRYTNSANKRLNSPRPRDAAVNLIPDFFTSSEDPPEELDPALSVLLEKMSSGGCSAGQKCSRAKVSVACQTDEDSRTTATAGCEHANPDVAGKSSGSSKAPPSNNEPTTSTQNPQSQSSNSGGGPRSTEDGLLRVTIQNFSKMSDTLCSPTKRIKGVPWRIMVMPKQHMVQKKSQKCMGFFLQCCPDNAYNDTWSCLSVAEMRLITQKSGVTNFIRKTTHTYTAKENDWGYSCFMTWADVLDENQGYIKDDKVVLEIHVKSEAPKNMMSRAEFVQALDQWYRLAEMQLQRGNIDLAIEANGQAIAYCKDKDKESLERLNAQKALLVNQKIAQSIQRLEFGGVLSQDEAINEKLSLRAVINGTAPKPPAAPLSKKSVDKPHNVVKKAKGTFPPKANNGVKKIDTPAREQVKKDQAKNSVPVPPPSDNESDDRDAEEYGDDLDLSIDTVDTMDIFLPVSKDMKNSEYVKKYGIDRVFEGSQSSLEDDSEKVEVETNEFGCQTEPLVDGSCAKHRTLQNTQQIAVGTTSTRVGIQAKPDPSTPFTNSANTVSSTSTIVSSTNTKVATMLTTSNSTSDCSLVEQTKADFNIPKGSVAVVRQLAQAKDNSPDDSQAGAQECVAVVIASHIASINCSKVIKEMDSFINTAEGLFKSEGLLLMLQELRKTAEVEAALAQAGVVEIVDDDDEPNTPPTSENAISMQSDKNVSSSKRKLLKYPDLTPEYCRFILEKFGDDTAAAQMTAPSFSSSSDGEVEGGECEASESENYSGECSEDEDEEESLTTPEELDEVLNGILSSQEFRLFQRHCTSEAADTVRSLASRELFNFNGNMARAMSKVQHLSEGIATLYRSLNETDITKLAAQQCAMHADAAARAAALEIALNKEKMNHQNASKLLSETQVQVADLRTRGDHMNKQMKEKTNELKKFEKKSSRDDNKIAELIGEKTEMEDRIKTMKRELDTLKKKSAEETKKIKREREKETDKIKKMEQEIMQRMTEKEKETKAMEDRSRLLQSEVDTQKREVRNVEAREKKNVAQASQQVTAANAKVQKAEAMVLEMRLNGICAVWDRVTSDSEKEITALEELLGKCRSNGSSDTMLVERSLLEWSKFRDGIAARTSDIRMEFLPQIEDVRKGELQPSAVKIIADAPPAWPAIVRVSGEAPIVSPPPPPPVSLPGVIGQPRTPQSAYSNAQQNGYSNGSPTGNGLSGTPRSQFSRAPSPPVEKNRIAPIGSDFGPRPTATVAPQTVDALDGTEAHGSCTSITTPNTSNNGAADQWGWNPLGLGPLGLQSTPTHRNLYSDPHPHHWDAQIGQSVHSTPPMQGYPTWSSTHGGHPGTQNHQNVQPQQPIQQYHQIQHQAPQQSQQHQMSVPPPGVQSTNNWSPGWPHQPPSQQTSGGYQSQSQRQMHKFM